MRDYASAFTALISRLGKNPALRNTALNQIVRLLLGPVVLIALPVFLGPAELGFWYAMTGVAAILAFADMGLSTAVLQFSAHEHAASAARLDSGSSSAQESRALDALLVFAVLRIAQISLIGLPVVFVVGLWTMGKEQGDASVAWLGPWFCFCLASALALIVSVMLSFREGQDGVQPIQRLRAGMSFVTLAVTIVGAAAGLGVWTLPVASLATTSLGFAVLARSHLPGIARCCQVSKDDIRDWSAKMSSILSRYSLSWVGGYVLFQLFAPLAIYFEGPVLAGRVGLTVSVFSAIFSLANVWSLFRLPILSMAVAAQNAPLLRRVFLTGTMASFATYLFFAGLAVAAYFTLLGTPQVSNRLLDPVSVCLLLFAWGGQVIVHNASLFLRAFKIEQQVLATWMAALSTVGGSALSLAAEQPQLIFAAFAFSYVWWIPTVYVMCRRRLREMSSWRTP